MTVVIYNKFGCKEWLIVKWYKIIIIVLKLGTLYLEIKFEFKLTAIYLYLIRLINMISSFFFLLKK